MAAPEPVLARKMWRTLEPYHGMIYFSPHATAAYADLGVRGQAGYFASRAAAMGRVDADVVVATFFNFYPPVVHAAIPDAWTHASPEQLVTARVEAVDRSLREVLGDDVVASDEMVEAAELARRAAERCHAEGRPLYAAHAGQAWPDPPHLALWHAITLLREFRGDGHIAALVLEGVDGCEALITHGASGDSPAGLQLLQATRQWPDDEWEAAYARLAERGWVDGGSLTDTGAAVRQRVEDRTDEAALTPWAALGEEDGERLRALVRPWSRAISDRFLTR